MNDTPYSDCEECEHADWELNTRDSFALTGCYEDHQINTYECPHFKEKEQ